MKKCPYCGEEYTDKSQYCLECGTLLEPIPEPPRKNLVEHLQYGLKIARKRPSVFLPSIVVYALIFIVVIVFVLSIGADYAMFEDPSAFDPEMIPSMTLGFLAVFLGFIYIGLIFEPFSQHVYYAATTGEEIRLWKSFRYANSRIFSFLGAYLLGIVVTIPIFILWFSKLPIDLLMHYDEVPNELIWSYSWPLLFFVPLGLVYEMALSIMVWGGMGVFNALKVSLDFLRSSYASIGGIFVIRIVLGLVSTRIPFGAVISWIVSIILYIALIDVFQRYREFSTEPETGIA